MSLCEIQAMTLEDQYHLLVLYRIFLLITKKQKKSKLSLIWISVEYIYNLAEEFLYTCPKDFYCTAFLQFLQDNTMLIKLQVA